MSIALYRLGRFIAGRRGLVLGVWGLLFAFLLGCSALLGDHYDDSFSIPGTQSQQGQDVVGERFGQTGATGQILFTVASGTITDAASSKSVAGIVDAVDKVRGVKLTNPLTTDPPTISKDSRATLGNLRFSAKVPSDATLAAVLEAAEPPASSVVATSVGGDAYKSTADPSHLPELLGLFVSFLILAMTFGSLLAAGMPITTSLVGVGVTVSAVVITSHLVTVSSTAPTLAEMLGLAVGIDYALFILSRHRRQLAEGLDVAESMARALATAGSAVVFAGATVIIALAGLSVAQIPVLSVMGLSAAGAVAVAVVIALTLLPAIALLLGERLRPKPRRRLPWRRRTPATTPRAGFASVWVKVTTRIPVLTALVVVAILGLAAVPALSLRLAIPDNSTAPTSSVQRQTYDKITEVFGEGYNAPLSMTADIITSSDPKGTVNDLAAAIKKLPGVVAVTQATPNQEADTALIQVIPPAGQTAASTVALVQELRAQAPALEKKYSVSNMLVTGTAAINIDASARLGGALLPFGIIVIGLSLILLMIVFRSIAVPLKATLGYLLSVGAALGAVVAVFQLGWLDALVPGLSEGPIVSFLPIFVMGVLFGLAMDYEMFLVSAMREDFVHTGEPHEAVTRGFQASARVVTAAALIMVSVFVAFIPSGTATIQQIAFGLAIGVFVDAFLVRMTLVPAVMVMLGRHAWWLPTALERGLPVVDVEGAALQRKIEFDDWETSNGATTLLARDLVLVEGTVPVDLVALPGQVNRMAVPDELDERELGLVLAGRRRAFSGELVVGGHLVPEQREAVNREATYIDLAHGAAAPGALEEQVRERARLASFSRRHRRTFEARATGLVEDLTTSVPVEPHDEGRLRQAVADAAMGIAGGVTVIVLSGLPTQDESVGRTWADSLAVELVSRGMTVILLQGEPGRRQPVSPAGPELRGDDAGTSKVEVES
jgi:RND superfamily putative drug exporter